MSRRCFRAAASAPTVPIFDSPTKRFVKMLRHWVCRYPDDAWEVLMGYEQEKFQGGRAGDALVQDLIAVDSMGRTPADDMQ